MLNRINRWLAARRGRKLLSHTEAWTVFPSHFHVHPDTKDDILHFLVSQKSFIEEVELPEGYNGIKVGRHVWQAVNHVPKGDVWLHREVR